MTIGAAALDGSDEGDDVNFIINPYRFASGASGAFHTPSQGWEIAYLADDSTVGDGNTATTIPELNGGTSLTNSFGDSPILRTTGLGGQPAYDFVTDGVMSATGVGSYTSTEVTVVVVFESDSTSGRNVVSQFGAFGECMLEVISSTLRINLNGGPETVDASPDTSPHVVIASTFANSKVYYDGAEVVSDTGTGTTSFTSSDVYMGGSSSTGFGIELDGRIAFYGVALGALSTSDRESIEAWVGAKYGISIS